MKPKNKQVFMLLLALLIIGLLLMLFFMYRTDEKNKCDAIISEVRSLSKQDPLYEPPMEYFECTDGL